MDKLSGKILEQSTTPKTSNVSGTFDYNYMQCLVIVKRMRSLAYTFSLLAEESKNDILNKSTNIRPRLPISAFWSCHAHASCADCEVCCSCVLKMFVEIHLLSERNYVGDNYVAVSNIINGLMRKLAYQNEIQKKRKEAEENRKKAGEVKYINEKKNEVEETVNWPDDLMELANNWDNLPENQGGNVSILKSITASDIEQLTRSVLEPTQQRVHNAQIMRGWSVHRQAMVARPLIGHINSRALINRAVIPRPILTHQINTTGRPLMSHIVASRHHIMSQIVTGRPILSRVISGHSLTGHAVTAQSLMNHPTVSGRHILQTNTNSTQLLQNHNIPRQIHHNLSFFNYNPNLSSRSDHTNN